MAEKILLLDTGGTQTLPIAKSLYKNGFEVYFFYRNRLTYGFGSRYSTQKILAPSIADENLYMSFLIEFLKSRKIDVIIPLSDPSALMISKHSALLKRYSRLYCPEFSIFERGYDKNKLMALCLEFGFPHPQTIDLSIVDLGLIPDHFFPAMLKPNETTGGRGMSLIENKEQLLKVYSKRVELYGQCHLQQYIPTGGKQYKVELFVNDRQELIGHSVMHKQRYYPVNGGSSCCNTTIVNDELIRICYLVLVELKWVGFADFDLIEDPRTGEVKIMEINPRIPACIKSAIESGVDYAEIFVDSALGKPLKKYTYQPGQQLRHIGFDFLWLFKSKKLRNNSPSWFRFMGKNVAFQDFSLDDPMPFLYGTLGNIMKMMKSDFKEAKNSIITKQ